MFKAFDATKCIACVMGTQGTRGLFNHDSEPEVALLWDLFKSHWRANQKMFEICERVDDVLPVRVQGMLDFGIDPVLHFNLKPGLPFIKNVTLQWNTKQKSKTIILCFDAHKENEAKKAAAALAAAPAPVAAPAPAPPAPAPVAAPAPAPAPPAPAPVAAPAPPAPAPVAAPAPAPAPVAAPPAPVAVAAPMPPPRKAPNAAQLTMERVREIRKFNVDNPTWSTSAIANHFDIGYNVAYKMLAGNTYKEAT